MRFTRFLRRFFLLCMFSCSASLALAAKPNIVFILADDLGINDLGCYGRTEHHTPHLDQLAREGARFASAYCAQPICSPSRAAVLTGKAPARLHLTTFLPGRPDCPSQKLLHPKINQHLPLSEITLAEALKRDGYVTAHIGKWHLGGEGFLPTDQGFDVYHPGRPNTTPTETEGGKGEYDLTHAAMQFMETNRTRPFFLYLPHNSPHIAYAAKSNLVARNARAFEPTYAALIETLDDSVGLLLKKIDALGLRSNTIVVFTSDNGGLHVPEARHERITHNTPYRAGKGFLYEGGVRIPLIVRWPGLVPPRVIATPVMNTDWLPTLLEFASAPALTGLDGKSFARLLKGDSEETRTLFWHFPHYTNQGSRPGGAVREGDWKLIEHYDTGRAELYDLKNDVSETTDLAGREPARVETLKAKLAAWRISVVAQTNSINSSFNPALYKNLYEDTDVSRYEPPQADAAMQKQVLAWRKQMNAVVPREGRSNDLQPPRRRPLARENAPEN